MLRKHKVDGMAYEETLKRPVGRPRKVQETPPKLSKKDRQFVKFMDDLVWEFIKTTNNGDVLNFLRWLSTKPKITG